MDGISFIIRARNEPTLEESIRSLLALTFPHEIIVILHRCTDGSADIVAKYPQIRCFTYEHKLSRAGYELLATDKDSDHSFVAYTNFCFSKARYRWTFKWDADFIASPGLISFLNTKTWTAENTIYRIAAKNSTPSNIEGYLSDCTQFYVKWVFWELPFYTWDHREITLDPSIYIDHCSELCVLKDYWKEEAWFNEASQDQEASQVRERIRRLTADFGPEPVGLARGSNRICDDFQRRIQSASIDYISLTS